MSDYGHNLAFGSFLTPAPTHPAQVVELATLSEQVGLELATFQDHPLSLARSWTPCKARPSSGPRSSPISRSVTASARSTRHHDPDDVRRFAAEVAPPFASSWPPNGPPILSPQPNPN
ncbi:MAG: hypothetical protein H0U77_08675 [Nocardioidaceae bacterium]|nr:hypothetical protein [Nocardioidaceae bacterium]